MDVGQVLGGEGHGLVKRFSVLSLGVMVLLGVVLVLGTSYIIEDFMIERSKVATVHLAQVGANMHLTKQDFASDDFTDRKAVFENYFGMISTPEIARVKIYNTDGVIVYSNEERLIGQSFLGNPELEKALEGEVEVEIERNLEEEEENLYERGFRGLMEIYIPIAGEDGSVFGAVEVYQVLDPLDRAIGRAQLVVGGLIMGGLAFLYLSLIG
ncbi:MAG: hypothetical protein ACE5G7_06840, partial [Candidatus Hydrothermarchaeaceae archaeon]